MVESVVNFLKSNFETHINDLYDLIKIPSVSFPDFDPTTLDKSADAVANILKKSGLENVRLLKLQDTFPYIYGDHLHQPGKPTVLLYAHHDVQPPGREEVWETPPFEPIKKDGPDGERIYGRGSADDKAGILVHTAAISAYLSVLKKLPLNVKVIIEGEEEIGSPHLSKFLNTHKDMMAADFMILTDTANYDCGIPSLTVGLRGIVAVELELRALTKTVHSGFWGGLAPDPAMALTKMLSDLVDENGKITIQEILDEIPPLTDQQKETLENLPPFDGSRFKDQSGIIPSAKILDHLPYPMAQLWWYPSLIVNGIQASSRHQPGNIINDVAWTKLSIRLAPGMDAKRAQRIFVKHLKEKTPWGLELKIESEVSANGWSAYPFGKNKAAFDAALIALEKGYGKKPVLAGCGATIPFVEPFATALKDAPALLIGIEDPYTNAHGENESLLISDFQKACVSQVYLLNELANLVS